MQKQLISCKNSHFNAENTKVKMQVMTLTFDLDLIFIGISRKCQNRKPHVIIFTYGQDIAKNRKFCKKTKFNAKTRNLFFDQISRNEQTIYLRVYRCQISHQILSLIIGFREEDFFQIFEPLGHRDLLLVAMENP